MAFSKFKNVKTRKKHFCYNCQKEIPKGSYVRSGVTTDPDIVSDMRRTDENGKLTKQVKILSAWWCNKCYPIENG